MSNLGTLERWRDSIRLVPSSFFWSFARRLISSGRIISLDFLLSIRLNELKKNYFSARIAAYFFVEQFLICLLLDKTQNQKIFPIFAYPTFFFILIIIKLILFIDDLVGQNRHRFRFEAIYVENLNLAEKS